MTYINQPIHYPTPATTGRVCPRCNNVYSPSTPGCHKCNTDKNNHIATTE